MQNNETKIICDGVYKMSAKYLLNHELKYCSNLLQLRETGTEGLDIRIMRSKQYISILKARKEREEKWKSMLSKISN